MAQHARRHVPAMDPRPSLHIAPFRHPCSTVQIPCSPTSDHHLNSSTAACRSSHGEASDGAGLPSVQPRRGRRRDVAQPAVGVHQRRGVRLRRRPPRRWLPGAAVAVGGVHQGRPRCGRRRAAGRAGSERARPAGARRRRRLQPWAGRARHAVRARRARRLRRAARRCRANLGRAHLVRNPDGERAPARPGEARPEPAHRRAGTLVPRVHTQHVPSLRASQRARPDPAEERAHPVSARQHPLLHRRRRQPERRPRPLLPQLPPTGEELGVVLPVRELAVPGGRAVEPPQGVQDAAYGRAGAREAARRRAGEAEQGEGGQGASHPGGGPEGEARRQCRGAAARAEGSARPAAAGGLLQGRSCERRQLV